MFLHWTLFKKQKNYYMKTKQFILTTHMQHKLKEFFNPSINQGQILFIDMPCVVELLITMGFKPNKNNQFDEEGNLKENDYIYFDIPEEFRTKTILVEKKITW